MIPATIMERNRSIDYLFFKGIHEKAGIIMGKMLASIIFHDHIIMGGLQGDQIATERNLIRCWFYP